MEEIIKQSPENLDKAFIEKVFNKHDGNVLNTLSELWDISEKIENISEEQLKWQKIRDIYDDIDSEMYRVLRNNKK